MCSNEFSEELKTMIHKKINWLLYDLILDFQFYFIHLYLYPFPLPPYFDYCRSTVVCFQIEKYEFFNFVLFKDYFGYSGSPDLLHEF